MGNCLAKGRRNKRNAVAPAPEGDVCERLEGDVCERHEGDVCERLSRATPRPGSSSGSPADMVNNLQEIQFEASKIANVGDALPLDVNYDKPVMDGAFTPVLNDDQVHYSTEEQELMDALYIIVLDKLRKITEKARRDVNISRKLTAISEESEPGQKTNL